MVCNGIFLSAIERWGQVDGVRAPKEEVRLWFGALVVAWTGVVFSFLGVFFFGVDVLLVAAAESSFATFLRRLTLTFSGETTGRLRLLRGGDEGEGDVPTTTPPASSSPYSSSSSS